MGEALKAIIKSSSEIILIIFGMFIDFKLSKLLIFSFPIALLIIMFSGAVPYCDNCSASRIMHFLGGVSMALIFVYLAERLVNFSLLKSRIFIAGILVISFAALIGLLWELLEFFLDLIYPLILGTPMQPSLTDTMFDLFFDLIGGVAVAVFYVIKAKLSKENFS